MHLNKLYNSITQITIQSKLQIHTEDKYLRFLSGTGFFVYCPPYENDIFFVTANHCVKEYKNNKFILKGKLAIPYTLSGKPSSPTINFTHFSEDFSDNPLHTDDFFIAIIDKSDPKNYSILKQRALRLSNQDDIDSILTKNNADFIAVGYPGDYKAIDHDNIKISAEAKAFSGKFRKADKQQHYYEVYDTDWKAENLDGFSGSPVLYNISKQTKPVLLGIYTSKRRFLSINLVTDTITKYLYKKYNKGSLE
ncbi:unnamed protein product [Commensalibacter communis]|uniref:hypothetical protein n=1 Tax=Commensalibacter communis TaxID=2972786 RepID=UPI0022FFBE07|nr:hypothetical protein [Commensalibacter communis]CAI3932389.1 unnamed protein product [Commensalibacter communis]